MPLVILVFASGQNSSFLWLNVSYEIRHPTVTNFLFQSQILLTSSKARVFSAGSLSRKTKRSDPWVCVKNYTLWQDLSFKAAFWKLQIARSFCLECEGVQRLSQEYFTHLIYFLTFWQASFHMSYIKYIQFLITEYYCYHGLMIGSVLAGRISEGLY